MSAPGAARLVYLTLSGLLMGLVHLDYSCVPVAFVSDYLLLYYLPFLFVCIPCLTLPSLVQIVFVYF